MNTLNEIKALLSTDEVFYGVVEIVELNRVFISTTNGGYWYQATGFSAGDRVFIRGEKVELSAEVIEGNMFQV
jgi:hypothetical protein